MIKTRRQDQMTERVLCDNCKEELGQEPVQQGGKMYCCAACAFEAARSKDCSGRADGHISQTANEEEEKVQG
jgi:hypothetical protein